MRERDPSFLHYRVHKLEELGHLRRPCSLACMCVSCSGGAKIWVERGGGAIFIWYTHLHKFMWIYNIWDQFEELKAIHLNTKWYLMQLYKNSTKTKSLFIILYLSIEIFLTWVIYFFFRAKTQVMNATISS